MNPVDEGRALRWWRDRPVLRCLVFGHKRSLRSTGYGAGVLDYYCPRCQKRIESVPLAEMSEVEVAHVAEYGGFSTMGAAPVTDGGTTP